MHRRKLDLIGALCFVVSGMVWVLLPIRPLLVGMLLAVPLVFFLPGYTLTQVLFPRRALGTPSDLSQSLILQPRLKISQPFSAVDYMVFSLGLSLVIDIVTGLLLNLLPGGLQWQLWALSLIMVTGVFALLAIFLRRRQPGKQTSAATRVDEGTRAGFRNVPQGRHQAQGRPQGIAPTSSSPTCHIEQAPTIYESDQGGGLQPRRGLYTKEYVLLGLALGVVMLALWLSIIRPPQPQPSFTQFWMLPSTQANKSCTVLIGVRNFEVRPETYRIQVTRNGIQVASWPSIMLVPQQEWARPVPLSPRTVSGDVVVDARLYRLDQPGIIYREVHVTLHSC